MATNRIVPDKGWAWLVLLCAFLCNVIFDGIIFSFGLFFIEFLDHFGAGRGSTSWIGSTISAVYAIIGPVASVLTNKFGPRVVTMAGSLLAAGGFLLSTFAPNIYVMILTYGVMGGVGFGMMYLCAYVMIGHYFSKWRALATGLASCGSGVGTFIFAPLSVFLIDLYGWRGALMVLSGIVLFGCVAGMVFRPIPQIVTSHDGSEQKVKLLDIKLLFNPAFFVFCLSSFFCMIGFFVPFMFLPDMARKRGIPTSQGALLLIITGAANTAGRVLCGFLSDRPWADALKIYNSALILGGAVTVSASWLSDYWMLACYAAVFGFCVAAYVSLCAIILVEFLGLDKLSNSFGFLNMYRGISTFVGAPLAGFLFDTTGDYHVAFYVAGAAIAAAGIICLPLRLFHRCRCSNILQQYDKEKNMAHEARVRGEDSVTRSVDSLSWGLAGVTRSREGIYRSADAVVTFRLTDSDPGVTSQHREAS